MHACQRNSQQSASAMRVTNDACCVLSLGLVRQRMHIACVSIAHVSRSSNRFLTRLGDDCAEWAPSTSHASGTASKHSQTSSDLFQCFKPNPHCRRTRLNARDPTPPPHTPTPYRTPDLSPPPRPAERARQHQRPLVRRRALQQVVRPVRPDLIARCRGKGEVDGPHHRGPSRFFLLFVRPVVRLECGPLLPHLRARTVT